MEPTLVWTQRPPCKPLGSSMPRPYGFQPLIPRNTPWHRNRCPVECKKRHTLPFETAATTATAPPSQREISSLPPLPIAPAPVGNCYFQPHFSSLIDCDLSHFWAFVHPVLYVLLSFKAWYKGHLLHRALPDSLEPKPSSHFPDSSPRPLSCAGSLT